MCSPEKARKIFRTLGTQAQGQKTFSGPSAQKILYGHTGVAHEKFESQKIF
jgi:hypothetical protein